MQTQSFKKEERLSSQKIIEKLFSGGKRFNAFPVAVVWLQTELKTEAPVQVLISVSRKKFKRAVDRNLVKRRVREAYRKNKYKLYKMLEERNVQMALGLIYVGNEILSYKEVEEKIILVLQRLQKEYEKTSG